MNILLLFLVSIIYHSFPGYINVKFLPPSAQPEPMIVWVTPYGPCNTAPLCDDSDTLSDAIAICNNLPENAKCIITMRRGRYVTTKPPRNFNKKTDNIHNLEIDGNGSEIVGYLLPKDKK